MYGEVLSLYAHLGSDICEFLKCVDKFRAAVRIATVIQRIYAHKDFVRPDHLGEAQRK